ncbi:MAG: hypothetical protein DI598_00185 [Pseudopedobacter saltans]|uniref:Uncharacterized protein n=1 Tax=Pseudopedobacter saltans TaxID=151895 RepID=A0A2W5FCJ5_9SPHI|nr:MAG: hypothetical protein DI598_00185 [Pseudopedobacter saltans]
MITSTKYSTSLLILFLALVLSSCNHDYKTTQARIVERRDVGNGKIRLSYIFKTERTTIAGVKVVDASMIVPLDSCAVEYKVSNPLDNNLKLP